MPKRRANGEGNIRKRKDGRWEGRYTVGHDPETGKAIIKNVLGKTQTEVKEKLKKAIEENVGIDYGRTKTYTVGSWLEVWLENYAKIKLRPSTFKTSQGFLKNHIKPQIMILVWTGALYGPRKRLLMAGWILLWLYCRTY